jgi:uncharacterized SAM-binding protein YcdF (DUF218 family)
MAMRRVRNDSVVFPPPARPKWLRGLGLGAFFGLFLALVAALLNPDFQWWILFGVVLISSLLGLARVSHRVLSLISSLVALLLALCMFTPILQPLERYLDVSELPSRADVIVVLGGRTQCGAAELGASSLSRLNKGLELWRRGYAKTITLSDTAGLIPGCPSDAELAKNQIQDLYGSNQPNIIVLEDMRTTRTEAEAVKKEALRRGWNRVLIVTNPTHSRRARTTFQQAGLNAFVVASSEPRFDSSLRLVSDRLGALNPLAREVMGMLKYTLFGWL